MIFSFIIYLILGAIAGLLSGLLGIGGGIIIVPALLLIFNWQGMPSHNVMQMAIATSLAAMVISSFSAAWTHYRHKYLDLKLLRLLLFGLVIGTVAGGIVATILHSKILKSLFGILLIIIAGSFIFNYQSPPERHLPGTLGKQITGFVVGFGAGLFGIGGGVISVPLLAFFNVPMHNAVGVSAAISFIVAIIGTVTFIMTGLHVTLSTAWTTGFIYWPAVMAMAIASPLFAYWGAIWAKRLPIILLRRIFGLALALTGISMLIF